MATDIRLVKDINGLIEYFAKTLNWNIDSDDFEDIEDISYDFNANDIGLKEEAFAKIHSLYQLQPLVDGQKWGIFYVEFDSKRFEVTALRKILSGLIPKRRNSADHAVWDQKDLLFICFWGEDNYRTIGIAHFEDVSSGLPQIKMISCAPATEDFTQIRHFEEQLHLLKWPTNYVDYDKWHDDWSSAFTSTYKEVIRDSSTLTIQLAKEAQGIRDRILDILNVESPNGYVHLLYEKFKNTLIHDMTETQFADMYAQTVVYGLFSARCMDTTQEDFSAVEAVNCIPNTNPFLKSLMKECLGSENTSRLSFDELEIGNVVDLLMHTQTDAIIADFNRQTGGGKEDPVIHFYEEFLTAYDKLQRVQRGVYYTPQPVVNFIVRAVDDIIKDEFGFEDGLASTATKTINITRKSKHKVGGYYKDVEDTEEVPAIQVLDPATGTGTFIRQVILQIYESFKRKNSSLSADDFKKAWNEFVPKHLLPRINAFELMMAPYAVAHMKLAMVLKDTGYDFESGERLNVYLTNSLEEPGDSNAQLTFWSDPLATESIAANAVKKNPGINIIIGNPPYSGESVNKNPWIMSLIEDYKKEPGGTIKLQEKNPKWLNDDYVKFIRYAQSIVCKGDMGIFAYICPHGFLDNPTFRGMRWFMLQGFDCIYVLNLHGNAKRKEKSPDGSKDDNVFDIMQGVCIVIGVRKTNQHIKNANVYYADCYGIRDRKYDYLQVTKLDDIGFTNIKVLPPQYYFVKRDYSLKDEYDKGFSVSDLFELYSAGLVTARDSLVLHDTIQKAEIVTDDFLRLPTEDAREKYKLGKDVKDWRVEWAQQDLRECLINGQLNKKLFTKIAYRLFDTKYGYYTGKSRGFMCRPRTEVMSQLVNHDNIAFVTVNRQPEQSPVGYYFIADAPVSNGYIRSDSVSIDTVFPLYIYREEYGEEKRYLNMKYNEVERISASLGLQMIENSLNYDRKLYYSPHDLLSYIYAVLYSESYRNKYSEYLKIDYPKVPYPKTKDCFWNLVTLGNQLINIHLLHGTENLISVSNRFSFVENGNRVVEKTSSSAYSDGRIYINHNSWFEVVPETVWTQYIGGYMPLQKWLKDHKGKVLKDCEIKQYMMIMSALIFTKELMAKIDKIIDY